MDYKQMVWVASYPKSGNTWFRCFLDAYYLGEVDINELICSVGDDSAARALPGDGTNPVEFPIDIQHLCRPMAMLRMVHQFEFTRAETKSTIPLFVKTHTAHVVANGIEMLPKSLTRAVIHIVRDPRDAFLSFAKHMGMSNDLGRALDMFTSKFGSIGDARSPRLADFISSWEVNVASYSNADTHNVRTWRYEDIKASPAKCFAEMLSHAGERPDMERVAAAVEMVDLANLQRQENEKGFRESSPYAENKFFGQGLTGGWVGKIPPGILFRLEKHAAPMMKRHGYAFANRAAA